MTDPAVTFDYTAWQQRFPGLANVSETFAELLWNEATLFCANVLGIVCDPNKLSALLNLLTAHLAYLYSPQTGGQPDTSGAAAPPTQVGRLTNASEGSVSAAFEMPNQPPAAAWYQQTQPGSEFWALTADTRTFRYVPGAIAQPAFPYYLGGFPFRRWPGGW